MRLLPIVEQVAAAAAGPDQSEMVEMVQLWEEQVELLTAVQGLMEQVHQVMEPQLAPLVEEEVADATGELEQQPELVVMDLEGR